MDSYSLLFLKAHLMLIIIFYAVVLMLLEDIFIRLSDIERQLCARPRKEGNSSKSPQTRANECHLI